MKEKYKEDKYKNKDNNQDARSRIIEVTIDMINESDNINSLTIRKIAEKAQVGTGLINYHFHSKDNLLSLAIGKMMQNILHDIFNSKEIIENPLEKLKHTLKTLADFSKEHIQIMNFLLKQCLVSGNLQAELFLIPLLKEIYGNKEDEMNLRIIAMQIIIPIQLAVLSKDKFEIYSGINLYDKTQRDNFIDSLIDNLLKNIR